MKGRAGSFSFYSSKGRQVARVAQNSSNYGESARRSEAQQVRRVKWANLVNFYKICGKTLHGAYESKRPNETDYNAFMRKNIPLATVALTKNLAAQGCCAAQAFIVSEGSMRTSGLVKREVEGTSYYSIDIVTYASRTYTNQSVSDFTSDVLDKNDWAKEGMQISLLAFNPGDDVENPRLYMERWELTLSLTDNRDIKDVTGGMELATDAAGHLYFPSLSTDSYVAVILSDSTSGQLRVSTERLMAGDTEIENYWASPEAVEKAMESYGVDAARFLDSGDLK